MAEKTVAERFKEAAKEFHRVSGEMQELLRTTGNDAAKTAKLKQMRALEKTAQDLAKAVKKKIASL